MTSLSCLQAQAATNKCLVFTKIELCRYSTELPPPRSGALAAVAFGWARVVISPWAKTDRSQTHPGEGGKVLSKGQRAKDILLSDIPEVLAGPLWAACLEIF